MKPKKYLLFLHFCVKSGKQRGHKVVTAKSNELDLLLTVSLHCRVCSKISVSVKENNNGSFITLNMAYTLETCANKKINCVFFFKNI